MVEEVRAMVTLKPQKMVLQTFPYPEQVLDDALVAKIRMTGICGTDHHTWSGHMLDVAWPIIQGHEPVAEVFEIGEKAAEEMEVHGRILEEGDRITWSGMMPCGKCWSCKWLANNIRSELCEHPVSPYRGSCKDPPHLFGCFAEYMYIGPGTWIYKLPKDMPDKIAVLLDTLSSGGAGIDRALSGIPSAREGFMWGNTAVVQGSGPVGVMAAMKFREYGASKVIMVGGPEHRLELAEKFGVDHTLNIDEINKPEDRIREVMKLTKGRGADIVIEAAGVPAAFPEGIEFVRRGGIYVEIGCFTDTGTVEINPWRVCFKDLTLISQYGYGPQLYERDLSMLYKWWKNKEYPLEDLITHEFKLEDAEEGIKAHKAWKTMKCIVVP